MTDEKKIRRGGLSSELKDAAVNEDALEAVSGGEKSRSSKSWIERAWDWVGEQYGPKEDEQTTAPAAGGGFKRPK